MFGRWRFSMFFLLLLGCDIPFFKNDLPFILDVEKVEINNIQVFDEWGGWQGDGFTLEVYRLSEKTIQCFINKSSKNLPLKKGYQKYNWTKTPIDSSYEEIFIMCLNYHSYNEKIELQLNKIKELIKKKEIYYSFYYKPDKNNPQNVQFFILDTQKGTLYVIDQQI